uniref:Uncharacterized protein n=1 Tax=Meloidogyne enterolobii TaxID=390850 RepID=A0A6V7WVP8_MELEN|nr:unnamed protein product [Meloidogyne enterolobii]
MGLRHQLLELNALWQHILRAPFSLIDYTLLVLGLIISIILSVLLSFFCCLLCNGCWLHRRRNPHMYENVNDDGFYPICCGFGIPMGTVVFSTHPPQFRGMKCMEDHHSAVQVEDVFVLMRMERRGACLRTGTEMKLLHNIN